MTERIVDLGCGPKKTPGALGVDIFPFPGVDVVTDLDKTPWPLEEAGFDRIRCSHVLEHVADVVAFLAEVHRIAKPGATLHITTPHFSSLNSWSDPTHLRHLAANWYDPFTAGGYLAQRTGVFEPVFSTVQFGKSFRSLIPKLMVRLLGQHKWEKHFAFVYPGVDLETELKVIK